MERSWLHGELVGEMYVRCVRSVRFCNALSLVSERARTEEEEFQVRSFSSLSSEKFRLFFSLGIPFTV